MIPTPDVLGGTIVEIEPGFQAQAVPLGVGGAFGRGRWGRTAVGGLGAMHNCAPGRRARLFLVMHTTVHFRSRRNDAISHAVKTSVRRDTRGAEHGG